MLHLLLELEEIFKASPFIGLGVSFLAGIVVSFSPCNYPLIPITLGIVGAESASTKIRGFFISFTFVLGIAVVYTILGIVSSLFGVLMGTIFASPITYLALTIIFFILGLSLLEGIKINIPFFAFNYECSENKELFSIFILGVVSGLAIIPCNFPVLGAILSLISLKKNVVYGGFALFLFSLGYGMILIVLGTFTALIRRLPKKGPWLKVKKRILGVILIAVGIYFLTKFIALLR